MRLNFLVTVLLLQLIRFSGFAADIHVYTGGSIQNAVNSAASGDRILLHNGTYSQVVSIAGKNGLTVTSAGDGAVTVQGNGTADIVVYINNSSNITVSNLSIKNTFKSTFAKGIYIDGAGSNINITGNEVTDISYRSGAWSATDNPASSNSNSNPILVAGSNTTNALSGVTISGNNIHHCMTGWSEAIAIKGNVDGFLVKNNIVHHVTNIAMDAYGLGSWPNTMQARNGQFVENTVYEAICNYTDNGGIYVDGGKDIVIANNKVYNSVYGITIGCENQGQVSGGTTSGIKVVNNLVYNNRKSAIMVGTSGDDDGIQGNVVNCLVTGNTFLKNATADQWASEFVLQNCSNIQVYNNILYGSYQVMITQAAGVSGNTFGYNTFYNTPSAAPLISKQTGTTWTTISLAQFKSENGDGSSNNVDPLLTNASATSPDVHLLSNSPCINTGMPNFVPLAGEKDIDGHARIFGSAVDKGVDESGSTGAVTVTGVSVSPTSASIAISATTQLAATVTPSNATNKAVTWSSGNTAVATVSSTGLVTAAAAGSATITVTTQQGGFTATSSITVTAGGALPSPWVTANIGAVGATGSASHNSGAFSVTGSGADIYGNADEFRFVYRQLNGNGEIKARVVSIGNTDAWAKAGVMIRENLTPNSNHALCAITPINGGIFQRHVVSGDVTTQDQATGVSAPRWIRLVRSGNTITAYHSGDGSNWTQLGSQTIAMAASVYIGMAVTSHNDGVLCTGVFDNVTISTAAVPVSGITVSPTSATLQIGGTQQLTSTISPANATNQNKTWTSSNTAVATVNTSGLVTAVSAGNATITATTQDGSFTASSAITVTSGSVNITINGNLSDWSSIASVATATGQTSTSLKLHANTTTLFVGVAGSGMSATNYQIFINSDNNAGTGYQDVQFTSSGADYMIEDGTLYKSTGTGWAWTSVPATIQVSKNTSATELGVNRSAFTSLASTIGVAYKDIVNWNTVSKLPSTGGYAPYSFPGGPGARVVGNEISEKEPEPVETTLKASVYSNPTMGRPLRVRITIPVQGYAQASLSDQQGRNVFVKDFGVLQPGVVNYEIQTTSYKNGIYFLRVQVAKEVATIKVVINQ